jgi:hypothetical protein
MGSIRTSDARAPSIADLRRQRGWLEPVGKAKDRLEAWFEREGG